MADDSALNYENGEVFLTDCKTPCDKWKRLKVSERILSSAAGWAEYWLLQQNGKIVHFTDSAGIEYVVSSGDVNFGTGVDENGLNMVKLVYISAGEMHTIGCTEGGQVGELKMDNQATKQEMDPGKEKLRENAQWLLWKPILIGVQITQVSCGKEHVVLLSNFGQVFTYGMSSRGQLGHGSTENCEEAKLVEALEGLRIIDVAAGGWHSAVISDIGDVYVWGWNESGQLGLPSKNVTESHRQGSKNEATNQEAVLFMTEPRLLDVAEGNDVVDVSCGSRHSAIVTAMGDLLTTGWNGHGQLGHGDITSRDSFTRVESLKHCGLFVEKVHCGYWGTLIRTAKPVISESI